MIVALNVTKLTERAIELQPELKGLLSGNLKGRPLPENIRTNPYRLVLPVEPLCLIDRMVEQRGTFFCSADINTSFEENLRSMEPNESMARKFLIGSDRENALEDLRLMNITRATLFPGLGGYAQSFHYEIQRPGKRIEVRLKDSVQTSDGLGSGVSI